MEVPPGRDESREDVLAGYETGASKLAAGAGKYS